MEFFSLGSLLVRKEWQIVIEKIEPAQTEEVEQKIRSEIEKKEVIVPDFQNIFACLTYCGPSETRVVILGQDPYPKKA